MTHDIVKSLFRHFSDSMPLKRGVFFILYLCAVCGPGCGPVEQTGDQVILVVGSRKITENELKREISFISSDLDLLKKQNQIYYKLIDQAIEHFLIMEYGKKEGIGISENELQSAIQQIKDDYRDGDFEEALLRGYTDYKEWRHRLKERLLINKIIKKVTNVIPMPTDQDIKDYYMDNQDKFRVAERLKFRQIVCTERKEAENLLKRLHNGEAMEDLAKKYSVAPEAENGGEVGWVARGQLEESMEKTLFSMDVGTISNVVKTPYGYHIFEVLEVRPEGIKGLSEVRQEIMSKLRSYKQEAFYKKWLDTLKSELRIDIDKEKIKTLVEKS
jgi:parvulin-like peptidyl-prolyl isomerase